MTAGKTYQIAIQFSQHDFPTIDHVADLERELRSVLGTAAFVDGHDFGSGEANIFVLTEEPETTKNLILDVLRVLRRLPLLSGAGIRERLAEDYERWWPRNSNEPFEVK